MQRSRHKARGARAKPSWSKARQAVAAMGGRRMLLPISRAIALAADPGKAAADFAAALKAAAE